MSIPAHIQQYLDEHQVRYEHITQAPRTAAQEAVAKTVVLTDDLGYVMAVLPANRRISLDALHAVTGRRGLRIATEIEFQGLFPHCETGAMDPFGNLYEIPVFVDASLREDESITFHAGTHQDAIRMPYAMYEKLVAPVVGSFGELAGAP